MPTQLGRSNDRESNLEYNEDTDWDSMTYMDGILVKDAFCLGISDYFAQKIPEFTSRIFDYGGLSKYVEKANSRGTRTMCGDVELLTFAFAGRLVITFRFGEEDLTFVGQLPRPRGAGLATSAEGASNRLIDDSPRF